MFCIFKLEWGLVKCLPLALCFALVVSAQESQTVIATPEVISTSVPPYPSVARAAKASGIVEVEVEVAEDGSVTSAKSIDGHPLLRNFAEDSALKWRFAPAKDKSDTRAVRLTFTLRLLSSDAPDGDLHPIFHTPYHVEIRQTLNPGISDPAPILTPAKKKKPATRKPKCRSRRRSE